MTGTLRRVDGSDGDGDDRRFVRWISGLLTGRSWTTVVTVVYEGTLGFCPYESGFDGGDVNINIVYFV